MRNVAVIPFDSHIVRVDLNHCSKVTCFLRSRWVTPSHTVALAKSKALFCLKLILVAKCFHFRSIAPIGARC